MKVNCTLDEFKSGLGHRKGKMVDNISAYNLRLAKEKRRIGNAKGTLLTKAAITKQAVINLRLRDPKWMRKAREAVKQAIRNAGEKISACKVADINNAAKELIRQRYF